MHGRCHIDFPMTLNYEYIPFSATGKFILPVYNHHCSQALVSAVSYGVFSLLSVMYSALTENVYI